MSELGRTTKAVRLLGSYLCITCNNSECGEVKYAEQIRLVYQAVLAEVVSLAAVFVSSHNSSPQQTAVHIQTTFLSSFQPITAMALFSGTVSCHITFSHAIQSYLVFYHIKCGVKLSPRKKPFLSSHTLVFVLNKTDLKLLFDYLFMVSIV